MSAATRTPTPTILDVSKTFTQPVDGDPLNADNMWCEVAPGAVPKLTTAHLMNLLAGLAQPTVSDRGALAADETLVLGSMEYRYDEPAANRIVYLPAGTYDRQTIRVRGTLKSPTYKIEFQHIASTTAPITFPSTTSKRPWAVLEWSTSGTPQWHVLDYGGGASLP